MGGFIDRPHPPIPEQPHEAVLAVEGMADAERHVQVVARPAVPLGLALGTCELGGLNPRRERPGLLGALADELSRHPRSLEGIVELFVGHVSGIDCERGRLVHGPYDIAGYPRVSTVAGC